MQIYYNLQNYTAPENLVLTIGSFDGLHSGHSQIIAKVKQLAQQHGGKSAVLTFEPHPRIALNNGSAELRILTTLPEKLSILEKMGIDIVFVQTFDPSFYTQTADEYIRHFLYEKISAKHLVVGYDHRFGAQGTGNTQLLMQHSIRLGFAVHEIPACIIHQNTVSSTKIRNHLINNELDKANDLLGYPYHIAGTVVQGDQLGRTIGFPTANIGSIQPHKLIPAQGIYAVRVLHDHHYYNGMFYIGSRPTLTNTTPETRLEVFIFDFDKNVYEHNICVELIKHLRPDQKFDGLEALKNQLKADQVQAMACLV